MTQEDYLRPSEAADFLRLSTSTLAKMRLRGDGPPYVKSGLKVVLYHSPDLHEWLARRKRNSTSEVLA
nr:helix-turn-helix domain-containing protein [Devosia sp. 1635]